MNRKNDKKNLVSYENTIKKSNELSKAFMKYGLTLNQLQLFAFTIYCAQQNGQTEFHKADFEKQFEIDYKTAHAKVDVKRLKMLSFTLEESENVIEEVSVFRKIRYDNGMFSFKWEDEIIPHVLELKDKWYTSTDLKITANFKSGFSWILYDYLKAHYNYWHKPIPKEALMRLFGVEDKKTYQTNTGRFKATVLDFAIKEINEYTEFEVWYKEIKEGRSIVGFDLHWSTGKNDAAASKKQIKELKIIVEAVFEDMLKYVNLKNDSSRERAIMLVKEIESFREFTTEPICITSKHANSLLEKANMILSQLEGMVETEQNTASNTSSFYDWLENRE